MLTHKQAAALRAIAALTAELGRPPRLAELAARIGCNKGNAAEMARRLEERGFLGPRGRDGKRRLVLAPGFEPTAEGRAAMAAYRASSPSTEEDRGGGAP